MAAKEKEFYHNRAASCFRNSGCRTVQASNAGEGPFLALPDSSAPNSYTEMQPARWRLPGSLGRGKNAIAPHYLRAELVDGFREVR